MKDFWGVFFNDAHNAFYLPLYMVSDIFLRTTQIMRGMPMLPFPHMLHFPISSKESFYYVSSHIQDVTYYGLCYISCDGMTGIDPTTHHSELHPAPSYHSDHEFNTPPALTSSYKGGKESPFMERKIY